MLDRKHIIEGIGKAELTKMAIIGRAIQEGLSFDILSSFSLACSSIELHAWQLLFEAIAQDSDEEEFKNSLLAIKNIFNGLLDHASSLHDTKMEIKSKIKAEYGE